MLFNHINNIKTLCLKWGNALYYSRQRTNWTLHQVSNRWMRAIIHYARINAIWLCHFPGNKYRFLLQVMFYQGYLFFQLEVDTELLNTYLQLTKYLFERTKTNKQTNTTTTTNNKTSWPASNNIFILYSISLRNNAFLLRFHKGVNLDCCSKDSQDSICIMTSGNAPDKVFSNTQSICYLPERKSSKRTGIWPKCSLEWRPTGSANSLSLALSLLQWIFYSDQYLLAWSYFFFLSTETFY